MSSYRDDYGGDRQKDSRYERKLDRYSGGRGYDRNNGDEYGGRYKYRIVTSYGEDYESGKGSDERPRSIFRPKTPEEQYKNRSSDDRGDREYSRKPQNRDRYESPPRSPRSRKYDRDDDRRSDFPSKRSYDDQYRRREDDFDRRRRSPPRDRNYREDRYEDDRRRPRRDERRDYSPKRIVYRSHRNSSSDRRDHGNRGDRQYRGGVSPRGRMRSSPSSPKEATSPIQREEKSIEVQRRKMSYMYTSAPKGKNKEEEYDYNPKFFKVKGKTWVSMNEVKERKKMFTSTISLLERYKFETRIIRENIPFINESYKKIYEENPHIREVFVNREQFYRTHRKIGFPDRVISFQHTKRTPYRRRGKVSHTVDHWGQRKLLLSEIEFLSRFYDHSGVQNYCIYAGAAPGKHIPFLLRLFPKLKLVLVDPAVFRIKEIPGQIEIINGFFTNELAKDFREKYCQRGNKVWFISDIRGLVSRTKFDSTMEEKEKQSRQTDIQVEEDMKMQHDWHNLLQPNASIFKFRLSYYPGKTEYLAGDIYFPIFTGKSSSESRIMVVGGDKWPAPTRVYDHEVYENIMYHFHSKTRTSYFEHEIKDGEGLCHCYDCSAEIYVLEQYFGNMEPDLKGEELNKKIVQLSIDISREISDKRTLGVECFKHYKEFFDSFL